MLVLLGRPNGCGYVGVPFEPEPGDPRLEQHRRRLEADWGDTLAAARARPDRDWQAARTTARERCTPEQRAEALEQIAELLDDAAALVERLRTPVPSWLKFKPGQMLAKTTDADWEHWERETAEGRLNWETWGVTLGALRLALVARAELGSALDLSPERALSLNPSSAYFRCSAVGRTPPGGVGRRLSTARVSPRDYELDRLDGRAAVARRRPGACERGPQFADR